MKKRNLAFALLLPLLVCAAQASSPKEIKARLNQFKVGDKTICLDEFTYPNNLKMKSFENGFVISKKNNVLTYQIVSMFLLGNDVTANVKAIVESRAGKNGLSTTFKQAFIDVSGMDKPEQADAKAKLIREFEKMTSAKQEDLPYSSIVLNDKGYVITTVETNGTSVSECFVTPYKKPTKD
jgi:hypothetical protein